MKQIKELQLPNPKLLPGDVAVSGGYMVNNGFRFDSQAFFAIGQPYRIGELRVLQVLSGSANLIVNLVSYHIEAGDVMLMPSGSIVELRNIATDTSVRILASVVEDTDGALLVKGDDARLPLFESMFQMIHSTLKSATPSHGFVHHQVLALIALCSHSAKNKAYNRNDEVLDRFIRLVNTHCHEQRKIPFYADQLNLSSHHLSALIKKTSGKSVMAWVNKAVMQRAKILLQQGMTTLQVSEELNFTSPTYFNRFFKRYMNCTPGEYRVTNKQHLTPNEQ